MSKRLVSFLLLLATFAAQAQDTAGPQMADGFRAEGKIYVVIAVIGLIFLAIVLFLVYIERKVKKLEDQVQK